MDVQVPKVLLKPLVVPEKTLMGPGPTNCSLRVLQSLRQPILGHMHPETFKLMDEVKEGIRYVFQTKNELTLAISTSGHGGMEAIMCNLLEPGDKALIAVNGMWGTRAANMAKRYGGIPVMVEVPIGSNFSYMQLEKAMKKHRPKLLFIVQGESSGGVFQPLKDLGHICHSYNCLLTVDTVASLGAVEFFADRWGVDAVYTGSQKVLAAPPGLTPITFSPRAQKVIFERKTPVSVFYLDMTQIGDYWNCFGNPRFYHHTISATLLYGLREALALVAEEGLENVIKRHQVCAQSLYEGLNKLGLQLFVPNVYNRLPTVTLVKVPEGVNWREIVDYAMELYSLEMAGGLGDTANKVLRIGLMGPNANLSNVNMVLTALREALNYIRINHLKNKL